MEMSRFASGSGRDIEAPQTTLSKGQIMEGLAAAATGAWSKCIGVGVQDGGRDPFQLEMPLIMAVMDIMVHGELVLSQLQFPFFIG